VWKLPSDMPHGITIGNKHSYRDFHLIPSSPLVIAPPEPKTSYDDTKDGEIDRTMMLRGEVKYENRKGSLEFTVLKRDGGLYSEIMAYLHGKEYEAVLDDDPAFSYKGRFFVESYAPGRNFASITIGYILEPYKYKDYVTVDFNKAKSKSFTPDTLFVTPSTVTVSPTADLTKVTLTNLVRDPVSLASETITINTLSSGKAIVLDGEAMTVLEAGANKYADTELWHFPSIVPGKQTVKASVASLNIQIKYRPRYI